MDFTGSDWCGWCIMLDKEIFSKPEFKEYASKNLVLLELDFPRRKELSEETMEQNERLAITLSDPGLSDHRRSGRRRERTSAQLGYMQGGPQAFIAELEKLRKG